MPYPSRQAHVARHMVSSRDNQLDWLGAPQPSAAPERTEHPAWTTSSRDSHLEAHAAATTWAARCRNQQRHSTKHCAATLSTASCCSRALLALVDLLQLSALSTNARHSSSLHEASMCEVKQIVSKTSAKMLSTVHKEGHISKLLCVRCTW